MHSGTGRPLAARSRGQLILLATCGVVGAAATLALPAALGAAIDGGGLTFAAVLIGLSVVCDLFDAYAGTAFVASETARLRHNLIRHVLAVSPHRLLRFSAGDLASRVSGQAPQAAQQGFSRVAFVLAVLPPVGSLILLGAIDLRLGAVFLTAVGLVAGVLRSYTRRTTDISTSYQRTQSGIAGLLTEALAGARTIAAAGTLDRERQRILAPLGDLGAQGRRLWSVLARSTAQSAVTGPVALIAVLATGGVLLAQGAISPGELFAAGRYASIGAGIGALTGVLGGLARSRAAAARLQEVTAVEPLAYGPISTSDGAGRLDFVGVGVDGILQDACFTIPGGASAAVVGRSGSGKSVLAELAARLRDPDRGEVRLDGVRLPALSQDVVRTAIGCAFEKPSLWGHTVADAIGCGRSTTQAGDLAVAAQAHDFLIRLPGGYQTPLADTPMSGGELQRIGLARALAADRLLVLDDATSSVDIVTERRITEALLSAGRTRMIVTHRMTTAEAADLVVWLADGRIRAVGPHERLWAEPEYRAVFS